jgi:hypothetical protein
MERRPFFVDGLTRLGYLALVAKIKIIVPVTVRVLVSVDVEIELDAEQAQEYLDGEQDAITLACDATPTRLDRAHAPIFSDVRESIDSDDLADSLEEFQDKIRAALEVL